MVFFQTYQGLEVGLFSNRMKEQPIKGLGVDFEKHIKYIINLAFVMKLGQKVWAKSEALFSGNHYSLL